MIANLKYVVIAHKNGILEFFSLDIWIFILGVGKSI